MSRNKERVAAQTLSTSQRQLDQYHKQLNDMLAYREEYRASLRSGSASPMNGAEAQKLRAFIAQVDIVIEGVQDKIRQASRRCEGEREQWAQQSHRSKALDGVAGRALKQEQNAEEARSQREIDDRFALKSRA